jgi:hypothetical protein
VHVNHNPDFDPIRNRRPPSSLNAVFPYTSCFTEIRYYFFTHMRVLIISSVLIHNANGKNLIIDLFYIDYKIMSANRRNYLLSKDLIGAISSNFGDKVSINRKLIFQKFIVLINSNDHFLSINFFFFRLFDNLYRRFFYFLTNMLLSVNIIDMQIGVHLFDLFLQIQY